MGGRIQAHLSQRGCSPNMSLIVILIPSLFLYPRAVFLSLTPSQYLRHVSLLCPLTLSIPCRLSQYLSTPSLSLLYSLPLVFSPSCILSLFTPFSHVVFHHLPLSVNRLPMKSWSASQMLNAKDYIAYSRIRTMICFHKFRTSLTNSSLTISDAS